MTQDVVRLWSELSCGTLTSSSSRRNCSWLLRALARARFEILQVAVMAPCGRDADGLTSFCERYREQPRAVGCRRRATLRERCLEKSIHESCRCGQLCEACASAYSKLSGFDLHGRGHVAR